MILSNMFYFLWVGLCWKKLLTYRSSSVLPYWPEFPPPRQRRTAHCRTWRRGSTVSRWHFRACRTTPWCRWRSCSSPRRPPSSSSCTQRRTCWTGQSSSSSAWPRMVRWSREPWKKNDFAIETVGGSQFVKRIIYEIFFWGGEFYIILSWK